MRRSTVQRAAIWEALEGAEGPLLPEEVLTRAQARCSSVAQATVYRALARLEADGRVHRVYVGDDRARFETTQVHHHHFQCTHCGQVFDLPGCVAPAAALAESLPDGFRLEEHEVLLRGACPDCA